jgi:hypothetical protein
VKQAKEGETKRKEEKRNAKEKKWKNDKQKNNEVIRRNMRRRRRRGERGDKEMTRIRWELEDRKSRRLVKYLREAAPPWTAGLKDWHVCSCCTEPVIARLCWGSAAQNVFLRSCNITICASIETYNLTCSFIWM